MNLHWTHYTTIGLILATITSWIAWDIYVASDSIIGNTESEIIRFSARNSLLLTGCLGILISHWLWQNNLWLIPGWITLTALSIIGITFLTFDIHYWLHGNSKNFIDGLWVLRKYPMLNFAINTIIGWTIWTVPG